MSEESALDRWEATIRDGFVQNWRLGVTFFAIFFALYFSEFAEYNMRVDEEVTAFSLGRVPWVSLGRWGTWLLESSIIQRTLNPTFSLACFGVLLSASYLVFCRAIRLDSPFAMIAGFALFAGFPTWYYLIEFKGTIAINGIAILLATIAGARFPERRGFTRVLFVLLVAGAISIYQSSVLLAIAVALAATMTKLDEDSPSIIRPMIELALLVAGAVAVYLIVWMLSLEWTGLEVEYITRFFEFSELESDPLGILRTVAGEALGIYAGTGPIFYGGAPFTGVLFVLGALAFALRLKQQSSGGGVSWSLVLSMVVLFATPFLMHLPGGGALPIRTLLSAPIVFLFVASEALRSRSRVVRLGAGFLTLVLIFQYFQLSSYASFSHQFVAAHDRVVAGQIYQRIADEVEDFDRDKTYPVDFVGALRFPNAAGYLRGHSAVTGSSIFEWDGGNSHRITAFMGLLGMGRFEVIEDRERSLINPQVEAMPRWPSSGSVREIDGTIIVKFGDYAPDVQASIDASKSVP